MQINLDSLDCDHVQVFWCMVDFLNWKNLVDKKTFIYICTNMIVHCGQLYSLFEDNLSYNDMLYLYFEKLLLE